MINMIKKILKFILASNFEWFWGTVIQAIIFYLIITERFTYGLRLSARPGAQSAIPCFILSAILIAVYKRIYDRQRDLERQKRAAIDCNNRGCGHAKKREFDKAIWYFNKAIVLNPKDAQVYCNRGNTYADKSLFDLAFQDLDQAIEMEPDNDELYFYRGNAHRHNGERFLAIQDYRKAIELNPKHAGDYFEESIQDCNKAIELNPKHALAYYNRGIAYAAKGQSELAKEDFIKAFELDPQIEERIKANSPILKPAQLEHDTRL